MSGACDRSWPLPLLLSVTRLSLDQRRTLLAGVALSVAGAHQRCHLVGPVHLTHVEVDASGRPSLRPARVPEGWSVDDDLEAVRRLARSLGSVVADGDLEALVAELLDEGVEPLPIRPRTARWRARPRWWGRRR